MKYYYGNVRQKKTNALIKLGASILFTAGLIALAVLVVFVCWNHVMPYLFGLPSIDIWEAFAIWALTNCLFGRGWVSTK